MKLHPEYESDLDFLLDDVIKRGISREFSTTSHIPSTALTWNNITAKVPTKTEQLKQRDGVILRDVFGHADAGEVMAIMGSSGAGKSTLLNVLAQRNIGNVEVTGSLQVNGKTAGREDMRELSAYVEQHDIFAETLTVREHLTFHANLRLPHRPSSYRKQRVDDVIRENEYSWQIRNGTMEPLNQGTNWFLGSKLGLSEAANTLIGGGLQRGLSCGEKRRLLFGTEILTNPRILLCDEPTSGLDAFLASQVVKVLKALALRGMTVVFTIHQPSSTVFHLIDKVYLMAEGRTAFFGRSNEAVFFWDQLSMPVPHNFNPSDHFIATLALKDYNDVMQRRKIEKICDKFAESKSNSLKVKETPRQLSTHEPEKIRNQASNMKNVRRDPDIFKAQIIENVFCVLVTGILYTNITFKQEFILSVNGVLFELMSVFASMFQYSCLPRFQMEHELFFKEQANGLYQTSAYFFGKLAIEMPWYMFVAVMYDIVLLFMSNLVPSIGSLLWTILIAIQMENVAVSFALAIACSFSSDAAGMATLIVLNQPLRMFAGFFINQESIPIYFIPWRWLSYQSFAYENMMIVEWREVQAFSDCNVTQTGCYHNGLEVLTDLHFSPDNFWRNELLLLIFGIVFQIIALTALIIRARLRK